MAGVGREAAQRTERVLEAADHRVQRRAQAVELILGLADREPPVERAPIGDRLDLVDDLVDGTEGAGRDQMLNNGREGRFTLRNARVTGALLTATKEYSDGETRKFEAVFVERKTVQGKKPDAIDSTAKAFGLGWVEGGSAVVSDVAWSQWSYRVFLERVK